MWFIRDRTRRYKADNENDPLLSDETYRDRQNLVAVIAIIALFAIALWLYHVISGLNSSLRCLQSGRTNCVELVRPVGTA